MIEPKKPALPGRLTSAGVVARVAAVLLGEVRDLQPRLMLVHLLARLLPRLSFSRLRAMLYRLAGPRIGAGTLVLGAVDIRGEAGAASRLSIGKRCMINTPCFFDLNDFITLGDDVSLSHHVVLVTSSHLIGAPIRRAGLLTRAPIRIEDGAWIGASVTILPGVTVGKGAIVAAGAVVVADVPPNSLVGGIPARSIKPLPDPTKPLPDAP